MPKHAPSRHLLDQGALLSFWAYTFLLPFQPICERLHSSVRSFLIIVMGVFVLKSLIDRRITSLPSDLPIMAYCTVMAASIPLSFDPAYSASCYVKTLLPMLVIYLAGSRLITNRHRLYITVLLIVCSSALVLTIGLLQTNHYGDRLEGVFEASTRLGKYLDLTIPVTLTFLWAEKRLILRLFAGITSLLQIISLLASGTRGSLIGLGIAFLPFISPSRKLLATCAALLLCITIIIMGAPDKLVHRERLMNFITLFPQELRSGRSMEARFQIYQATWLLIKERPLTGWGYGNHIEKRVLDQKGYEWLRKQGINPPTIYHAHNLILEFMIEGGILALAAALWIGAVVVIAGIRLTYLQKERYPLVTGLFIGIIALCLHSMVTVPQWINSNLAMIYIAMLSGLGFQALPSDADSMRRDYFLKR